MTDLVDRHFRMVDEQSSRAKMQKAIKTLQAGGIDFTVEGGWAVTAYGSTVASVDLDVLVSGGLSEEVAAAIEGATGYQMYSQATHDTLALDFVDSEHSNALINRPHLFYIPKEFLADHTAVREIMDGVAVPVPDAARLTFMKLKAFHDRLLQWRAARGERYLLASFPEEERERTIKLGADHWLRKAGKDLFDASFLLQGHTTFDAVRDVASLGMWVEIEPCLRNVPLPVRAFAQDMADRVGMGDVRIIG